MKRKKSDVLRLVAELQSDVSILEELRKKIKKPGSVSNAEEMRSSIGRPWGIQSTTSITFLKTTSCVFRNFSKMLWILKLGTGI